MQNFLFIRLNPKNLIFFQWGVEECSDRASPPPGEDWRSGGAIQQERRDRGPNALSIAPPWGPRDPDRYGTFMRYSTMANSGTQKHLRVSLLEQGAFYFSLMLFSVLYSVMLSIESLEVRDLTLHFGPSGRTRNTRPRRDGPVKCRL